MYYLSMIGSIVIMIALCFMKKLARKTPTNYILLGAFTIFESHLLTLACMGFPTKLIISALFLTLGIFLSLLVITITSDKDLSMTRVLGKILIVDICISLFGGYFMHIPAMGILICITSFAIACAYILYDLNKIMGGKRSEISVDDYVLASMLLYIDLIRLFLEILRIL